MPDDPYAQERARIAILDATSHTRKLFASAADLEAAARETRKMAETCAQSDVEMIAEYERSYSKAQPAR